MNAPENRHPRIFIVDDHPVVRQGLRLLFTQAAFCVCGEAESIAAAMERITAVGADIAIVDLSLGNESGLDLIEEIRTRHCAVLVYSMHEDAGTIEHALTAGASAYVSKRENEHVLLQAVAELYAGNRFLSPLAAHNLADNHPAQAAQRPPLSDREATILACLGRGDSNPEIAAALSISVRTVETYCARLVTKLGLDGMRSLRRHAIRKSVSRAANADGVPTAADADSPPSLSGFFRTDFPPGGRTE